MPKRYIMHNVIWIHIYVAKLTWMCAMTIETLIGLILTCSLKQEVSKWF